VSSVYLFVGPRGVGKATMAFEFARTLNCIGEGNKPCGTCKHCGPIGRLNHPDVHLLVAESTKRTEADDNEARPRAYDPDKKIKIEQVRSLEMELQKPPFNARFRVVIVLDADNLKNPEAQNAFLKTLEDTPDHTVFVLVTSKPSAVLPTILSRSRRVRFTSLEEEDFRALFPESGDEIRTLFALSEGSVGKARLFQESGVIELRPELLRVLRERDTGAFLGLLKKQRAQWKRNAALPGLEIFLGVFQPLIRDLLLIRLDLRDTLFNIDLERDLRSTARTLSVVEIESLLDQAKRVEEIVRRPVNPGYALPLLLKPLYRGALPSPLGDQSIPED
jgi:DNA polymerase-3 subunit delta'